MLTIKKVKQLNEIAKNKGRISLYIIPTQKHEDYIVDELMLLRSINRSSLTAYRTRDASLVKIESKNLEKFKII